MVVLLSFKLEYEFIIYLYQKMYMYIVQNYITNVPTCFGASAPSSGSFDIALPKVTKY
jgi:hypothetical protein